MSGRLPPMKIFVSIGNVEAFPQIGEISFYRAAWNADAV